MNSAMDERREYELRVEAAVDLLELCSAKLMTLFTQRPA